MFKRGSPHNKMVEGWIRIKVQKATIGVLVNDVEKVWSNLDVEIGALLFRFKSTVPKLRRKSTNF